MSVLVDLLYILPCLGPKAAYFVLHCYSKRCSISWIERKKTYFTLSMERQHRCLNTHLFKGLLNSGKGEGHSIRGAPGIYDSDQVWFLYDVCVADSKIYFSQKMLPSTGLRQQMYYNVGQEVQSVNASFKNISKNISCISLNDILWDSEVLTFGCKQMLRPEQKSIALMDLEHNVLEPAKVDSGSSCMHFLHWEGMSASKEALPLRYMWNRCSTTEEVVPIFVKPYEFQVLNKASDMISIEGVL